MPYLDGFVCGACMSLKSRHSLLKQLDHNGINWCKFFAFSASHWLNISFQGSPENAKEKCHINPSFSSTNMKITCLSHFWNCSAQSHRLVLQKCIGVTVVRPAGWFSYGQVSLSHFSICCSLCPSWRHVREYVGIASACSWSSARGESTLYACSGGPMGTHSNYSILELPVFVCAHGREVTRSLNLGTDLCDARWLLW